MILLIDNYDSFVFNLARYVSELGFSYIVKRNDCITLQEIEKLNPSHIIISPGPLAPEQAGISMAVIRHFSTRFVPILGVCLGHQAIGQVYGGIIKRAKRPMHGRSLLITHDDSTLFKGLPNPLKVARYHSLIVCNEFIPNELIVTAQCDLGEIMALQHAVYPLFGVQFHPESILSEGGHQLLRNFLVQLTSSSRGLSAGSSAASTNASPDENLNLDPLDEGASSYPSRKSHRAPSQEDDDYLWLPM